MTLPESPRVLLGDGALTTWAIYVAAHTLPTLVEAGTFVLIVLRIMILYRQWKVGR